MDYLPLDILTTLVVGALSAAALLVIALSIRQATRLQYLGEKRRRQAETLMALSRERDLWEKSGELRWVNTEVPTPDQADYYRLAGLLTRLELIALGVNQEIYDEEIARRVIGDLMIATFLQVRTALYELRSASEAPGSFTEFESLVRRWIIEQDKPMESQVRWRARAEGL